MKRKTIDEIVAKAGIEPFPDDDPRYLEPARIELKGALVSQPSSLIGTRFPIPEEVRARNRKRAEGFDLKSWGDRFRQQAEANLRAAAKRAADKASVAEIGASETISDSQFAHVLHCFSERFGTPVSGLSQSSYTRREVTQLVASSFALDEPNSRLQHTRQALIAQSNAGQDMPGEWQVVTTSSDDAVSSELLAWSGMDDIWTKSGLDAERDFLTDVAEGCDFIRIERDQWDAGVPGRSGILYLILTSNAVALRHQLRNRVACLIRQARSKRIRV